MYTAKHGRYTGAGPTPLLPAASLLGDARHESEYGASCIFLSLTFVPSLILSPSHSSSSLIASSCTDEKTHVST